MSLAAPPPGSPTNPLLVLDKNYRTEGPRLTEASLGVGDGGLSGDMGFEPDGPPSPTPSNQPGKNGLNKRAEFGFGVE